MSGGSGDVASLPVPRERGGERVLSSSPFHMLLVDLEFGESECLGESGASLNDLHGPSAIRI
eukprot:749858-Hanusia_phi.AAC.9